MIHLYDEVIHLVVIQIIQDWSISLKVWFRWVEQPYITYILLKIVFNKAWHKLKDSWKKNKVFGKILTSWINSFNIDVMLRLKYFNIVNFDTEQKWFSSSFRFSYIWNKCFPICDLIIRNYLQEFKTISWFSRIPVS